MSSMLWKKQIDQQKILSNVLTVNSLSHDAIVVNCYDGAAMVSGENGGLQILLCEKSGRSIIYDHCYWRSMTPYRHCKLTLYFEKQWCKEITYEQFKKEWWKKLFYKAHGKSEVSTKQTPFCWVFCSIVYLA